jgi:uncharacterized protein (DUF111 family)
MKKVKTKYGAVRVKRSKGKWKPESDDVVRIARSNDIPLRDVIAEVRNIRRKQVKRKRRKKG